MRHRHASVRLPADVEGIKQIAEERGAQVIEDAARAFLAHEGGQAVGAFSDLGCFSFQQGERVT